MRRLYLDAFSGSLATVFEVAAFVSLAGFALTWLMPERPLRETVAAASSSIGQDASESFPIPVAGDPATELLRGLAILADRDVQRAYMEGITRDAGVDLLPAAAWLVFRISDDPATDIAALSRRTGIPLENLEAGMGQLRERGYVENRGGLRLTSAGCGVYDRLAAARRARLVQLQAEWPPEQRQHLADVLQRLAQQLVPARPA